jgi:TonB family protein
MKKLLLILAVVTAPAWAQTVYQSNEVEKQALPLGGAPLLNHFISMNLQLPVATASKGVNGRVFVKGIVETDGSLTSLHVIRGIDESCNNEAMRIMAQFKGWQPATIKGQPVRQWLIYSMPIQAGPITEYDSTLSAYVFYYDKNRARCERMESAKFRDVMPVNAYGYTDGDVLFQEFKKDKWTTKHTVAVKKVQQWEKFNLQNKNDSTAVTRITVPDPQTNRPMQEIVIRQDGTLLAYIDFTDAGSPSLVKNYYPNGILKQIDQTVDGSIQRTHWFESGLIRYVIQFPNPENFSNRLILKSSWDKDGNSMINDGNGWCKLNADSYLGKEVWEEGAVNNGYKSGKWVGKLSDSTLMYEESYENGKLVRGVSFQDGSQIDYTEGMQQPQFEDGNPASLYKFLANNIVYPLQASRAKRTGKVMLAFTVCEDGSLCDYIVEKGVTPSLDDEALRVVKKMSGKWQPGKLRGRKIRVRYRLPINFEMM